MVTALLRAAGIPHDIESIELLGIGSAGLNARGNRDEDGTHARVRLADGGSVICREYTPTGMVEHYIAKERAVFESLYAAGLPTPAVLSSGLNALLLADAGGSPLEEEFRAVPAQDRPALWSAVGAMLRRLHDVDVGRLSFLNDPVYQRPWTQFVPYFAKSLRNVKKTRRDLAQAIDDLVGLRRPIQEWLDSRPRTVCFNGGYYPPGMLVRPSGRRWECTSWLSLGYYVSIFDPARDVVLLNLAHREWTGDDLPSSFYDAYGSRPDELATLVYETSLQPARGASYQRGKYRAGWRPPPHSTAIEDLESLPQTVSRLQSLLTD